MRISPTLVVALVVIAAAAIAHCSATHVKTAAHDADDFCSAFTSHKRCTQDSRCEWCGSTSFAPPIAFCHRRDDNKTCCAPMASDCSFESPASLCTADEVCYENRNDTPIGPCETVACCKPGLSTICGGKCFPSDYSCCGETAAAACRGPNSCCNDICCYGSTTCCTNGDQATCCGADSTCCINVSHGSVSCCGSGFTCDIVHGCIPGNNTAT